MANRGRPRGSKNKPKLPPPELVEQAPRKLCPHCHQPYGKGAFFADVAPAVSSHSVLYPIPHYYKDRTNPAVLTHYLSRTMFHLLGIPVGAIRHKFLEELSARVEAVHPNYTRSAMRACLEADLTEVGPYLQIPIVCQEQVRRALETLDLLQTIADLRNKENRGGDDQEAKEDGLSDSSRSEVALGEDATGSGEGNVREAGEEIAPEEIVQPEEEVLIGR